MEAGGIFFTPAMFTINPGDTVQWKWAGGFHNTSNVTRPTGAPTWSVNISSIDTSYLYTPTISGLYTYTCTYHSGMNGQFFVTGCNYPAKPVIVSTAGNTGCQGDTLRLSVLQQTGASYQWLNGMIAVPFATAATLAVTTSGTYRALVNRCGVDSISDAFPVVIHSPPLASFTETHTSLAYTFTNTTMQLTGTAFLWTFSDGTPSQTTVNAFHTFAAPGSYWVKLAATDISTFCSDTFLLPVQAATDTGMDVTNIIQNRDRHYSFFPNPVASAIRINTDDMTMVWITDVLGHTSAEARHRMRLHELDVSKLPAGMYVLHIQSGAGAVTEKIMVAH